MNKTCVNCGITQSWDLFPSAGCVKGKYYKRKTCQQCYYQIKKKPRRLEIALWLETYKKTLQCKRCKNNDYRVLDFHHKGKKNFNIADAVSKGYSKHTINKELENCECLCANCHRIITCEDRKISG